jgi:hypothetical protein
MNTDNLANAGRRGDLNGFGLSFERIKRAAEKLYWWSHKASLMEIIGEDEMRLEGGDSDDRAEFMHLVETLVEFAFAAEQELRRDRKETLADILKWRIIDPADDWCMRKDRDCSDDSRDGMSVYDRDIRKAASKRNPVPFNERHFVDQIQDLAAELAEEPRPDLDGHGQVSWWQVQDIQRMYGAEAAELAVKVAITQLSIDATAHARNTLEELKRLPAKIKAASVRNELEDEIPF